MERLQGKKRRKIRVPKKGEGEKERDERRRTTPWAKKGSMPKGVRKIEKDCHAQRFGGDEGGGARCRAARNRGEKERDRERERASVQGMQNEDGTRTVKRGRRSA